MLRVSRCLLEYGCARVIDDTGACELRVCRTHLHFADRFIEHNEQARGQALWERVEAGSGSLGAASSESAAGSGRLRACGC